MKLPRRAFLQLAAGAAALPVVSRVAWAQGNAGPEAKLKALGIDIAQYESRPVANYLLAVQVGNLLFVSGMGPRRPDGTVVTGKVGAELTTEQGYQAARLAGLTTLANVRRHLGSLDRVKRIVRVLGLVHAEPGHLRTAREAELADLELAAEPRPRVAVDDRGEAGEARVAVGPEHPAEPQHKLVPRRAQAPERIERLRRILRRCSTARLVRGSRSLRAPDAIRRQFARHARGDAASQAGRGYPRRRSP